MRRCFQEILHRYLAIGHWAEGHRLFDSFAQLMSGHIEDVAFKDVQQAAAMASLHPQLNARDALHVAVMMRVGAARPVCADRGYDAVAGIQRLDPAMVPTWRATVER